MVSNVTTIPEDPYASPKDKSIVPVPSQEDLADEVPHIDFVHRDQQLIIEDCDLMVQILKLKHRMVQ